MVVNYMPCCISVLMPEPLAPSLSPQGVSCPCPHGLAHAPRPQSPCISTWPPRPQIPCPKVQLPRPLAKDPDTWPRRRGPRPRTAAPKDPRLSGPTVLDPRVLGIRGGWIGGGYLSRSKGVQRNRYSYLLPTYGLQ